MIVPPKQWSLQVNNQGILQYKIIPVPEPGPGEVLIKVMATPIDPGDIKFI
jgi:NADPH:quinone reductase-like Zn-dependent oxidoreductase